MKNLACSVVMLASLLSAGRVAYAQQVLPPTEQQGNGARVPRPSAIPTAAEDDPAPKPTVTAPTIALKPRYNPGEPIEAVLLLPEGQKLIDAEWESVLQLRDVKLGDAYVWTPGNGTWPLRANYIAEIEGKLRTRHVIDSVTVAPAAPDRSLAELAGKDAVPLAAMYRTLAVGVTTSPTTYTTPDYFWGVHEESLAVRDLTDNGAADAIAARIQAVIGKGDGKLDTAKLVAELKAIADALAKAPEPGPDPEPGPVVTATKLWLVAIDDAETRLPAQTLALTDVAWQNAIRAKGHDYEHYETGSADAARFSAFIRFPDELVVQAAETGKVLGVEELPKDASTAWLDSQIAKYSGSK